jgi:hypothetical protein
LGTTTIGFQKKAATTAAFFISSFISATYLQSLGDYRRTTNLSGVVSNCLHVAICGYTEKRASISWTDDKKIEIKKAIENVA